jgi:hypothetical protein
MKTKRREGAQEAKKASSSATHGKWHDNWATLGNPIEEKKGGGDRKLNLLLQVLSQRRSTAALLPIGVKWCQFRRHGSRSLLTRYCKLLSSVGTLSIFS